MILFQSQDGRLWLDFQFAVISVDNLSALYVIASDDTGTEYQLDAKVPGRSVCCASGTCEEMDDLLEETVETLRQNPRTGAIPSQN